TRPPSDLGAPTTWAGVPICTISPSRMIRIRSPSLSASCRSCVMKIIVLPTSSCSRMTSFCMSRRISGSGAENGSPDDHHRRGRGGGPARPDPRLHAAGELVWVGLLVTRQPDQVDHLLGPGAPGGLVLAAHLQPV